MISDQICLMLTDVKCVGGMCVMLSRLVKILIRVAARVIPALFVV